MYSCSLFAQLTDLARLEYSFIPKTDSEDQYTRLRAAFNYPIKTQEDCYLIAGAEYNNIILNLRDGYPFETNRIENIHVIDLNLGYTFKTKKGHRIGLNFNPRIASNLTSTITKDDFFLNGGFFFINDRTKENFSTRPNRLVLGLTYNATTGIPFPLPFVSYYREINEHWSYSAGIPKSNLKYSFNKKSVVQTYLGLDGYFANIQNEIIIDGKTVENISLSVIVGGLGYEYYFTKHLVAYAYSGYTLRLNNVLRDENRYEVFSLDDLNSFYLRTGVKFKI
ncbi:MAG: hypothetical protein HRU26_12500 [Psychroserpens sp.]|nr:hypothetical protein [Psychroserpens sp.]